PLASSATRTGESRTGEPTPTVVAPGPTMGAKMRASLTLTIAKTRGASKPWGTPVAWIVKAWTVPSGGSSTQEKSSEAHSGQKSRGGQAVRPQRAHAVVASRPSAG